MNANELADELEDKDRLWNVDENLMIKTCAMLRQQQAEIERFKNNYMALFQDFTKQQAEIESLKAEKIRAYDNGYEDGRKPNTNKAQEK